MRLCACLLDIDRFLEILRRDQEELVRYWVALGEERTMGAPYLASFEHWAGHAGREPEQVSFVQTSWLIF